MALYIHSVGALIVAALYIWLTWAIGHPLRITSVPASLQAPLEWTLGAAALSFLFGALALIGLSSPNTVRMISLGGLAVGVLLYFKLNPLGPSFRAGAVRAMADPMMLLLSAALAAYGIYVFCFSVLPFFGNDLSLYHLVIPNEVLRDSSFRYNEFFFWSRDPRRLAYVRTSGLCLGWT